MMQRTARPERDDAATLSRALDGIVADLLGAPPITGPIPTLLVAANEGGADTATIAFALADLAVDQGMRVLLVEGSRQRSLIVEAADPQAVPTLVEIYGEVRILLRAETSGLCLAPRFRNGLGIAAALARNEQADLVDDIAAAFDMVVIDGCRAADVAAAGWLADAYLRVGRFTSQRDNDVFLQTLDAPKEAFLGTVAASTFVPAGQVRAPKLAIVERTAWHAPMPPPAGRAPVRSRFPRLDAGPPIPRRMAAR